MKKFALLLTILMMPALAGAGYRTEAENISKAGVFKGATRNEGYLFRMLDTGSGLPDNNVRNMTMLPDGLMCIQTSSMLNIYDGAACRSYKYNAIEIPYTEYSGLNGSCYDPIWNVLWCTTRDHIWLFDLKSRTFEYDIAGRLSQIGVDEASVQTASIGEDGKLWLCTKDKRLLICDRDEHSVETVVLPNEMELPVVIHEHKGRMWVMSMNGVLAEYAPPIKDFRTIKKVPLESSEVLSSRMEMDITSGGDIWIMYDKALFRYEVQHDRFCEIRSIQSGSKDLFTTIALDNSDNLWVGTARSGVSFIDARDMGIHTFPYLEMIDGKKIYHHTDISKIYVDSDDGVWIATLSEGLLYWHRDIFHIDTIDNSTISGGNMNDESVKCMALDRDGGILVGTIHGLLRYDPSTRRVTIPYPRLKDELCISLHLDKGGNIWVGTFYNGAYRIDRNGHIRNYRYPDISVDMSYHESRPNLNCVRSFFEDREGNFWISVYGGVGRFDPATGAISLLRDNHPELARYMIIRDICDRGDGYLLMSGDNGRYMYSPADDTVVTNPLAEGCHVQTNQAIADRTNGLLWMATAEGLRVTDLVDESVYDVDTDEGMPAGNIMSIAQDAGGNIWAASFSSVSRVKAMRGEGGRLSFAVSNFNTSDGVSSGAFFQKSVLTAPDGKIYFGGAHGICEIDPGRLFQEKSAHRPMISSIMVGGKALETGKEFNGRVVLNDEIDRTDRIVLKHDETFLTFEFSNINYQNPQHTSYLFKLENFDKEWNLLTSSPLGKAQYTFLEPGEYRFLVKAANNGMDWGEPAEIRITIRPPFYRSIAAYVIYAILGIGALILIVYMIDRRARRRIRENREMEERRRKEELDQMKFRFFTNISHELRTPLSLIMLPLESVMKELKDSPVMSKLTTMHNNAEQLLSLVNHLLDFRKLEMGGEKLHLVIGNISEFTGNIASSFRDAAQKRGITLSIEDDMLNPIMAFDSTQMQKMQNNLLSNALKFTPDGGMIHIRLSQDEKRRMVLEVSDTGIGIPSEDLEHIFDRFYRSDNTELRTGSGIGLSLVKQYAEMHSGSISVVSEVGKGSTFTLVIPTDLSVDAVDKHQEVQAENESIDEVTDKEETVFKRQIMLVDDNKDFREYIVGELSSEYEVTAAEDGVQCLEMLKTSNPEVVICDVMMPNMDGFAVTKAIKSNIETSHIPVILLSARTSEDIRLEGYETGADAYLTKPFKLDILQARIRNLIEERSRRIASFSKDEKISPSEVTITTIDQRLMTRIMESIEKNMDNSEYSVEELSSDVGMHRMNLYRKIQSLAGMTPSEFIRAMRLKRAAQLLRDDPNLTVSEVSDMVGFNTQKYFTKYFKEMFGVPPSQYR
ncbi:MAG: ATP-binding protein [Candidatus Cryptobacteroides sp.]